MVGEPGEAVLEGRFAGLDSNGALLLQLADGTTQTVHAGEVLCIPSHMPHKAEAIEDTVDLDIFTPPRADWINKTDQYLRGQK